MTSQFITPNEVEDLSEAELRSKFTALLSDLMRTTGERAFALASLETVEAALNRKHGERARYPLPRYRTPGC
jgi:hypothetical protein